jgi:hypothetical protein
MRGGKWNRVDPRKTNVQSDEDQGQQTKIGGYL